MTTVGVLTGGGDCPGLNAVIRAVVRTGAKYGFDTLGIRDGWLGLIVGDVEPLTDYSVTGILPKGGTILGTSRTNPFKSEADVQRLRDNIRKFGIDAIVAIGGEDTLGVANKLSQMGIPVVGVPKTIDNDVGGTDYTFGFDTAVATVTEAIDRLHTTAESHHRIMVVEVMGRHAGWIATMAGIAGGADEILIPEIPFDLDEVTHHLRARYERGKKFSIVVVAEGAQPKEMEGAITRSGRTDEFGHVTLGGVGNYLRDELEKRLDMEVRVTVLGHVQRGGSPTAHDRVLATRFGVAAANLIKEKDFGKMVALRGDDIVAVPIEEAVANLKTVDMDLYKIASIFYGG
ncbi:6-phosphofructokinase [Methanoculleus thermophilus]|uniref:Pyrophosphate--fructose 6-phosphate 1-phosphotransferase n=1 Tax=Methanoculleus thermophilus TaxID=2200 RepID=A0A1G9AFE9_9EURY|nr:ATP-dependent 6-phosphofructokinase [Methanoculleus thermophilus]SDK25988.1 pyrophosphate-dependent phosphofructokinase [Methanoculleus thermophilus]